MYTPRPGDIGISSSTGLVGRSIRRAQRMIDGYSPYTHSFIHLNSRLIIEGSPKGVRFLPAGYYPEARYSQFDLTDEQRELITVEAVKMHGTGYSWLNFLALGATHWNVKPDLVRNMVARSGKMICSQFCGESYARAGVELFPDLRLPCDITPGDYHRLFDEMGWA